MNVRWRDGQAHVLAGREPGVAVADVRLDVGLQHRRRAVHDTLRDLMVGELHAGQARSGRARPARWILWHVAERDVAVDRAAPAGRPSTRSPTMLRWISSVPPAIDWAGTDSSTSATMPSTRPSSPVSVPAAPASSEWAAAARRATALAASLPSDPSAPGDRPAVRLARARRAVHSWARCRATRPAKCWRATGSSLRPVTAATSRTRSGRPARCGYHE